MSGHAYIEITLLQSLCGCAFRLFMKILFFFIQIGGAPCELPKIHKQPFFFGCFMSPQKKYKENLSYLGLLYSLHKNLYVLKGT